MFDVKAELLAKLREVRKALLSRLDGLSDYDLRRPLVPSGTNLLGLVKHVASVEYGQLGVVVGLPAPVTLPWIEDGSIWQGADMWATPEESKEYILDLYQRIAVHSDGVIVNLDLDAPATVDYWPEDKRETTMGFLLIRVTAEIAHHAGHADIVRELIDGKGGDDAEFFDEATWASFRGDITGAADRFRDVIYHIAETADWEQAQRDGAYTTSTRGRTLAEEGFIHASTAAQVADVANLFYAGAGDLMLLIIDVSRVGPEVRYEQAPGTTAQFPHIYGPLNLDAVIQVRPFGPGEDGQFTFAG
jgi:uncharacterized protein (DUF952 family)